MAIAICKNCIKEFIVKRDTKGIFCSLDCYHKNMVGKSNLHPKEKGKYPSWNKGMKMPNKSGENHPRWIKDRSKLAILSNGEEYRNSPASREWAKQVKDRDKWYCKIPDNNCTGKVVSHHILSWRDYPELRYEVNNGITLCTYHHPRKRIDEDRLISVFQKILSTNF